MYPHGAPRWLRPAPRDPPVPRGPLNRPSWPVLLGPSPRSRARIQRNVRQVGRVQLRSWTVGPSRFIFGCGCRTSRRLWRARLASDFFARDAQTGSHSAPACVCLVGLVVTPHTTLPGGCGPRCAAPVRRAGRSTSHSWTGTHVAASPGAMQTDRASIHLRRDRRQLVPVPLARVVSVQAP